MASDEYEFYNELKNWDFSRINYTEENLTNWDMYSILREKSNSTTKVLDLGTDGGENVLKNFPEVQEILATDFSEIDNNNFQKENINLDILGEYIKNNTYENSHIMSISFV